MSEISMSDIMQLKEDLKDKSDLNPEQTQNQLESIFNSRKSTKNTVSENVNQKKDKKPKNFLQNQMGTDDIVLKQIINKNLHKKKIENQQGDNLSFGMPETDLDFNRPEPQKIIMDSKKMFTPPKLKKTIQFKKKKGKKKQNPEEEIKNTQTEAVGEEGNEKSQNSIGIAPLPEEDPKAYETPNKEVESYYNSELKKLEVSYDKKKKKDFYEAHADKNIFFNYKREVSGKNLFDNKENTSLNESLDLEDPLLDLNHSVSIGTSNTTEVSSLAAVKRNSKGNYQQKTKNPLLNKGFSLITYMHEDKEKQIQEEERRRKERARFKNLFNNNLILQSTQQKKRNKK
ncbi:MAG: hypothetical protein MJ252_27960 [archaeon]|nr:hypothetical protein [archaeon]